MQTKFMPKMLVLLAINLITIACSNTHSTSNPSIKENSKNTQKISAVDYSNVEPNKLLKQVKAHYDLDEYKLSMDKLLQLLKNNRDSLDGTDLKELKRKIEVKLTQIEKKKQKVARLAQNKRLSTSLSKMNIKKEKNTTYYFDKKSPKFDTKECFYAYIKSDSYGPKLFFRIRYIDSAPLDIQEYIVTVDKLDHTINGKVIKTQTKGKKSYYIELLDKEITTPQNIAKLSAITNGNNVLALYVGSHQYKKREINDEQKMSIRNVLDAYAYLKTK